MCGESASRRFVESATASGCDTRTRRATRSLELWPLGGLRALLGKFAAVAQPCAIASERAHVQLVRIYKDCDQRVSAQLAERRANVGYAGENRVSQRDMTFTCHHSKQRAVKVLNDYLVDRALAEPLDQQNGVRHLQEHGCVDSLVGFCVHYGE